ncbi:hypothetical protein [Achromobacter sp.]|uniref:hypothetical protein n=1 Tax=Achromobacter sp. TaxID=134375 RepID=UPI002F950931
MQQLAFTCAVCGTDWDYLHDKRDPASGWRRCDANADVQMAEEPLARAVGAA